MKSYLLSSFLIISLVCSAQMHYNNLPVIKSTLPRVSYMLGNERLVNRWGVNPTIEKDVLKVPFENALRVGFITDKDSIFHIITDEKPFSFYIQINDTSYALTQIIGERKVAISFNDQKDTTNYQFWFENDPSNPYLLTLKEKYNLEKLVEGIDSDTAKVLRIVHWVNLQWPHNGSNVPQKPDALTILEEAKEGKNFRCTEYSIVTVAALKALGFKARMMYIYSSDVETTSGGGSHVVLEVFLKDYNKWVMLDGQHNVMPVLNKIPLNAVEFQKAIVNNYEDLEIRSLSGKGKRYYTTWIYPYLYFFETDFDNREGKSTKEKYNQKIGLRLGPIGTKNPSKFQGKWPMSNAAFTNSYATFYDIH